MVLATVRGVTRITSYSDTQSRLLLFILLNIIYASKRVTLVPCPLTTLAKAHTRLQILAKAHSSFLFQKAHTREIADAINMASASTPMRSRHSSREAPASASRTPNRTPNRTASPALNQTVRIPPLHPLHLYTSDVARDSISLTAVARQIAAARTFLSAPISQSSSFARIPSPQSSAPAAHRHLPRALTLRDQALARRLQEKQFCRRFHDLRISSLRSPPRNLPYSCPRCQQSCSASRRCTPRLRLVTRTASTSRQSHRIRQLQAPFQLRNRFLLRMCWLLALPRVRLCFLLSFSSAHSLLTHSPLRMRHWTRFSSHSCLRRLRGTTCACSWVKHPSTPLLRASPCKSCVVSCAFRIGESSSEPTVGAPADLASAFASVALTLSSTVLTERPARREHCGGASSVTAGHQISGSRSRAVRYDSACRACITRAVSFRSCACGVHISSRSACR